MADDNYGDMLGLFGLANARLAAGASIADVKKQLPALWELVKEIKKQAKT